ncbi:MAG: alpha/beta fold hydrolase [Bacilli bacterium]
MNRNIYHYYDGVERSFVRVGSGEKGTVVYLHGFLGQKETWAPYMRKMSGQYLQLAPDLWGHGKTFEQPENQQDVTFMKEVHRLAEWIRTEGVAPIYVVGYSMGARFAIALAATYPQLITGFLSIGGSTGLTTENERKVRRVAMRKIAQPLAAGDLEKFVHRWSELPLFATQKRLSEDKQKEIQKMRLSQQAKFMYEAFLRLNVSEQPNFSELLSEYKGKALFVAGELDEKYVKLAELGAKMMEHGEEYIVPDAGHAIHVEHPEIFDTIVSEFISKGEKQ